MVEVGQLSPQREMLLRLLTLGSALPSHVIASCCRSVLCPPSVLNKQLIVKGALDRSPDTRVRVLVLSLVGLVALGKTRSLWVSDSHFFF